MKRILRSARREAEAQGGSHVDIEHLLLGLLEEKEGLPAELFTKLGINMNLGVV
jgi:ATP-dependent Clp protease ATP-binding subunit ClpA